MDCMTKDVRALELYQMARSVVDAKGRVVTWLIRNIGKRSLRSAFGRARVIWKFGRSAKSWWSTMSTDN